MGSIFGEQSLRELQDFVEAHWRKDIRQLAFKKELLKGWENRFVLQQLYGKQKAKNKLPFFFNQPTILYPPKVSVEQSTSEAVAKWKTDLVAGESLLDMTGGFGIDSYWFATKISQVTYIEQQAALHQIVQHNLSRLAVPNIHTLQQDAVDFLRTTDQHFDWIYIDPARRDAVGNRKIGLADYTPNLLLIKDLLFKKGHKVLVKTSPMLDLQLACQQLEKVQSIYVVAVKNDVKELLFLLESASQEVNPSPTIHCINIGTNLSTYTPSISSKEVEFSLPKNYLYEPNAAILKAGLFTEIAQDFGLQKLHPNTHLYTSNKLRKDFPGRVFICESFLPFQRKMIQAYLATNQANITTRNFPYTVEQIKKKLKIKDGGDTYLFGVTLMEEQLKILVCKKVFLDS